MKFFAVAVLLVALVGVTLSKPTEIGASPQETPVAPRDKRGLLYGAYTSPVAYTAAYTAPVTYTSPYNYPYAYSPYSAYPYYASAYSAPYYLA